MGNGSLAKRLFDGDPPPAWGERMGIALDVARGLHYLDDEIAGRRNVVSARACVRVKLRGTREVFFEVRKF
jgi:hypothetical protein